MKISQEEIDAAKDADSRLSTSDVRRILAAALTVRKARKAAKRERQRKEKDAQVQESAKSGSKSGLYPDRARLTVSPLEPDEFTGAAG